MSQADRIYKKAFKRHFTNHEANFPPARPIELGMFGVMTNGYFEYIGKIADLGVNFSILKDTDPTSETFKSNAEISQNVIAKGQPLPNGLVSLNAQIEFTFEKAESVFFSSNNVLYDQIADLHQVGQKIKQLYSEKKWKKEWHIVSRVMHASSVLLIISGTSNSKATIEAEAGIEKINLNIPAQYSFSKENGIAYNISATGNLQLGMGFSRIYDPIFLQPDFKSYSKGLALSHQLDSKFNPDEVVFGDFILTDQTENYA